MSAKKSPAKKTLAKKTPAKKAAKKAAPKTTNIEKLVAADVIRAGSADKLNQKVINKLSPAEVNTLIKLRKKLGPLPSAAAALRTTGGSINAAAAGNDEALSPNFPV